jgi:hypothetical protein
VREAFGFIDADSALSVHLDSNVDKLFVGLLRCVRFRRGADAISSYSMRSCESVIWAYIVFCVHCRKPRGEGGSAHNFPSSPADLKLHVQESLLAGHEGNHTL